jgi:hypothetical protein
MPGFLGREISYVKICLKVIDVHVELKEVSSSGKLSWDFGAIVAVTGFGKVEPRRGDFGAGSREES